MDILREFFSNIYRFDELIRWGGYTVLVAIVFAETGLLVGFFLPGDSLLVTAGLVASSGTLNVWGLTGILIVAAILGDSTGYAIGYVLGPRLFRRPDSLLFRKEYVEKTRRFYEKYGAKTIVLARFVPIIRTFAPTVAGVARMRYRTFVTFNVAGGIGWVCAMVFAGYWLGGLVPDIEHKLHWVIGTVILLSFLPLISEWRQHRRERARAAAAQPSGQP